MKNIKTIIFSVLLLLVGIVIVPRVHADDVVVIDNGANSTNQVNNPSSTQTTVKQSNNVQINNSVSNTSSTGNNSASNNGSSTIATGNATSTTNVSNTANNSSISQNCCQTSQSASTISGNGAGSQNNIDASNNSQTSVSVNQSGGITNTLSEALNTGNNIATNNSGTVTIHTGDIIVNNHVVNGPISSATISVPNSTPSDSAGKISGNGAGSQNTVNNTNNSNTTIAVTNTASVSNNIYSLFTTGGNHSDFNAGNVDIETGNIIADTTIQNVVNFSNVAVSLCNQQHNSGQTPPPSNTNVPSTTPPSSGVTGQVAAATATAGEVLGSTVGNVLPATGNNWLLLFLVGNVAMLFLGAYLRLHSGRSPGFAFAF